MHHVAHLDGAVVHVEPDDASRDETHAGSDHP
jgi:hypothetical protein